MESKIRRGSVGLAGKGRRGTGLSLRARRIAAHRPRQTEIVAQHRPLIFGAEQTTRLQFRYDEIDKLVQPDWQMRRLDQETVHRPVLEPGLHVVGDLRRRSLERSLTARAGETFIELADGQSFGSRPVAYVAC